MNQARCDYYTNHIQQNSSDQRKLFNVTKSLLCDINTNTASFPRVDTVGLPMILEISLHRRLKI